MIETPPLHVIGFVQSTLKRPEDCPKQYSEGAPEATIRVLPEYAPGLAGLIPGQEMVLLTWLHLADPATLTVHPRGDASLPEKGVFSTRSPDRPNPVGLHRCTLLAVDGLRLRVRALEAVNGTPVLDIKPVYDEFPDHENWGGGIPTEIGRGFRVACARAWQRGLLAGLDGNASIRLAQTVVITRAGTAKGRLNPGDLTTLDLASGRTTGPGRASTEAGMHLEVYRNQPAARAVLHAHPPHVIALSLRRKGPLFTLLLPEARYLADRLAEVPPAAPGGEALAEAVGRASRDFPAVLLRQHGLLCWSESLLGAEALAEQFEALARIELLAGV